MSHNDAHRAVSAAIKKGLLVRPTRCEKCAGEPGLAKNGAPKIHGHHHDYSKPLSVEWLCAKCHRKVTPLPATMGGPAYGESNGASKLTNEQVGWIRSSNESGASIARKIGVGKWTVNRVRQGKSWTAAAPQPPQASPAKTE